MRDLLGCCVGFEAEEMHKTHCDEHHGSDAKGEGEQAEPVRLTCDTMCAWENGGGRGHTQKGAVGRGEGWSGAPSYFFI